MEEKEQLMSQRPGEVVETYRQPVPGEVVERYSRPLPGRRTPPPPAERRKKRRTGLWIFLICLTVVLGIAAGVLDLDLLRRTIRRTALNMTMTRLGGGAPPPRRSPSPPIPPGRAPCWKWRRTTARS